MGNIKKIIIIFGLFAFQVLSVKPLHLKTVEESTSDSRYQRDPKSGEKVFIEHVNAVSFGSTEFPQYDAVVCTIQKETLAGPSTDIDSFLFAYNDMPANEVITFKAILYSVVRIFNGQKCCLSICATPEFFCAGTTFHDFINKMLPEIYSEAMTIFLSKPDDPEDLGKALIKDHFSKPEEGDRSQEIIRAFVAPEFAVVKSKTYPEFFVYSMNKNEIQQELIDITQKAKPVIQECGKAMMETLGVETASDSPRTSSS